MALPKFGYSQTVKAEGYPVQLKNQLRGLFELNKADNAPMLVVIAALPKGKKPQDTDTYLASETLNSVVAKLLPDQEEREMNLISLN